MIDCATPGCRRPAVPGHLGCATHRVWAPDPVYHQVNPVDPDAPPIDVACPWPPQRCLKCGKVLDTGHAPFTCVHVLESWRLPWWPLEGVSLEKVVELGAVPCCTR